MVLFHIVILDLLHIYVVFFVHFLHNRNVLLINLVVLYEGKGLCFDLRLLEKGVGEKINNFRIYMCMIILSMDYKM